MENNPEPKPLYPRTFDKCPHCGATSRFIAEAVKEDAGPGVTPLSFSIDLQYTTIGSEVHVAVGIDVCTECGALYAVSTNKIKRPKKIVLVVPPGVGN